MKSYIRHVVVRTTTHEKLKAASGRYSVPIKRILEALVDMHIDDKGTMSEKLKEQLRIIELTESR